MEQLDEVLKQIEINHHTLKGELEYIIIRPVEILLRPNALMLGIPGHEDLIENLQTINIKASSTYDEFTKIGTCNITEPEIKYQAICGQFKTIESSIIPSIKEISNFYASLRDQPIFNLATHIGQKAYNLIRESVDETEGLCERLIKHNSIYLETETNISKVDLFELVIKVFGTLDADVDYKTTVYKIPLFLDRNRFTNDVLLNIYQNIERYAFPKEKYELKTLFQKKVMISFEEINNDWQIEISNNGEPFNGDITKMFECGYHHGSVQGSGYGMYTAKQYMKSIGGDIKMECPTDSEFKVKFILKIR